MCKHFSCMVVDPMRSIPGETGYLYLLSRQIRKLILPSSLFCKTWRLLAVNLLDLAVDARYPDIIDNPRISWCEVHHARKDKGFKLGSITRQDEGTWRYSFSKQEICTVFHKHKITYPVILSRKTASQSQGGGFGLEPIRKLANCLFEVKATSCVAMNTGGQGASQGDQPARCVAL
jgi:hypothetical protein